MGVNLSVRKFISKEPEELWNGQTVMYFKTEDQSCFDFVRHSGDRDFILKTDFTYIDSELPVEEQQLARPKDFNQAREWIKQNVFDGNQKRLLDALDRMQIDESLCFTWSW